MSRDLQTLTSEEKEERNSLRYLERGQFVLDSIAEVSYAAAWLAVRMGKSIDFTRTRIHFNGSVNLDSVREVMGAWFDRRDLTGREFFSFWNFLLARVGGSSPSNAAVEQQCEHVWNNFRSWHDGAMKTPAKLTAGPSVALEPDG